MYIHVYVFKLDLREVDIKSTQEAHAPKRFTKNTKKKKGMLHFTIAHLHIQHILAIYGPSKESKEEQDSGPGQAQLTH